MPNTPRHSAVLFDCDGILVASETLTNETLRGMLHELGWMLSSEECVERFVGKALRDEADVIEEHTGFRITDEWMEEFRSRRNANLLAHLEAIDGAPEAIAAIDETYDRVIACASGADRFKVELQLEKVGMLEHFTDRIYSGMETPRSKPAPDVYLAAAEGLGIDIAQAAVVEDSPSGVRAGVAAGATVYGYCPGGPVHHTPEELLAVGATHIFTSMAELPGLLSE